MADDMEMLDGDAGDEWYLEVNAHLNKLDKKVTIAFGLGATAVVVGIGANAAIFKLLKAFQQVAQIVGAHDAFLRGEVSAPATAPTARPMPPASGPGPGGASRASGQDVGAVAAVSGTQSIIHMDHTIDETRVLPYEMQVEVHEGPASEISDADRDALENYEISPGDMLRGDVSLDPKPLPPLPEVEDE